MKKGNQKRAYKRFAFSFLGFEIGANDSALNPASGYLTH